MSTLRQAVKEGQWWLRVPGGRACGGCRRFRIARLWLRKSFTDEMLEQWRRTSLCKDLPPDWQSTLAYELRRRALMPCTGCPTLIRGKRWAQPQGTELCAGCAARRLAEEVGRGPGRG